MTADSVPYLKPSNDERKTYLVLYRDCQTSVKYSKVGSFAKQCDGNLYIERMKNLLIYKSGTQVLKNE